MTPRSVNGSQRPHPRRQLALAAVDHDQRGQRGEALVALAVVRREVGLLEVAVDPPAEHLLHRGEVIGARPAVPLAAYPEPPVVGLLRRSPLEHDHRGDGVLAAEVGDVEALDPHRQLLHPERLRSVGERLDPALAPVLAAQPVLVEGEAGVALGQLAQAALVAALGDPHLDRGAAALAERLGEQLGALAQVGADDDRPRHRRRRRVVLADELLGDLGEVALGLVVEVEALALGEDAVADLEDLGVGVGALGGDADQVGGADRAAGDPLALEQRPDRLQPVAVERRRARTRAPRRPPPSCAAPRPRPGGSGRRGSRRSRRCCAGTPRG